ncbi:hypothetical protein ADU37_CDS17450 [Thermococcus sp. 2319x1]|nr:hypothetical protein ADU37_CDS17450 [Thermococcus sp. 2319x1]
MRWGLLSLFKNGKNTGFIFVSAREDMSPVLEFSYEFYLIFHNTWDSEKHYFVYGNWDTAIATYVYAYS